MPRTTIVIQTNREPTRVETAAILHSALTAVEGLDPEIVDDRLETLWGTAIAPTPTGWTDVVEMLPSGQVSGHRAELKPPSR